MQRAAESALPEVIRRIANAADRRLAWEFFVFFSRFEYSLKRHERYLKEGIGQAEANWDRFASDYAPHFNPNASANLAAAVSYYLKVPPRKQLRNNGKMQWSAPDIHDGKEPLLVWLLRVVRIVRNNLFHGGKFPLIPIADPSRDRELVGNAIIILAACLLLNKRVSQEFLDGIDE